VARRDPEKQKEYKRAWVATNRDRVNAQARKDSRKRRETKGEEVRAWVKGYRTPARNAKFNLAKKLKKLGLSDEQYAQMLRQQEGVCAVCGNPPIGRLKRRLNIDHCHSTGLVRGLLCDPCNQTLGLMKDDPRRLIAAAEYLHRSASEQLKSILG
jgi:hypothetical protein